MGFVRRIGPPSLHDYEPGPDFDVVNDLIMIDCGGYLLYALLTINPPGWVVDDRLMPTSIRGAYDSAKQTIYRRAQGVRIDKAVVNEPVVMSLVGYDFRDEWQSRGVVTSISPVTRNGSMLRTDDFPIIGSP